LRKNWPLNTSRSRENGFLSEPGFSTGAKTLPLSWIFIDIGGPIVDDGPLFDYLAAALRGILTAYGHEATGDRFQEALELGWQEGASSTLDFIIRHFTTTEGEYRRAQEAYQQVFRGLSDEEYRRFQIPQPGVQEGLEILSQRFKLATLSNNVVRVKELLEDLDIARHFEISGISEEIGFSKPDFRLFQHVLKQAGCRPREAMMVGDRMDNDILPAKKLGLRTAHVMLESSFGSVSPGLDRVEPDLKVGSLLELAQRLLPEDRSEFVETATGTRQSQAREGGAG
jgi:HAD superfamily hydrolase (TIGR01549 family)